MFMNIHACKVTYVCSRVNVFVARSVFVTVCTLACYRTNELTANTQAHTYSGLVLAWYRAGVGTSSSVY